MIGAQVVWDQGYTAYHFGVGHPMDPVRLQLTADLLNDLGLLTAPGVQVVRPAPCRETDLLRVHTPGLVAAVRAASLDPGAEVGHGVGTEDTPAFPGMHEATSLAVGGTLAICEAVWRGETGHAVNVAGGLHHAMPDSVAGFCVYNDVAVGIHRLLELGAQRVLYVDLDVHHGDGVERIFWEDPRVVTLSLHETGHTLYPGTGFPQDTGGTGAPDSAVNVALPPGTGDTGWLRALTSVLPAVARAVRPDVVVSQHGCDTHLDDPLAHLAVSVDAMQAAAVLLHDLAHELAGGRWVAVGGGGYEVVDVVPRAWSHLTAVAAHQPLDPTAPMPAAWRDRVLRRYGRPGPPRLGDRGGVALPQDSFGRSHDPDDPLDAAVLATRRAVFPGWGLDPYQD